MFCLVNSVAAIGSPSFDEFDRMASDGASLTVAFLGGSLTWGARASDPQKTSYRALVGKKLQAAYPQARFTFVDAAIGGTGAQLGAMRLDRDVLAYKPHLVFLDFTLNDGVYQTTPDTLAAQEAIIRRVLVEANAPVVQMFLAAKSYVTDPDGTAKMERRKEHLRIAEAYNVPCGDAIMHMQSLYWDGKLNLDEVWPPVSYDTTHPYDPGYALYAEAAWEAFSMAVRERRLCRVPDRMLHADRYMHVLRLRLSSLPALPEGWEVTVASRDYSAFDFLMSRWLDDVTVAANFIRTGRQTTEPRQAAKALKLRFRGESVLLFGEATSLGGPYQVSINGESKIYQSGRPELSAPLRLWQVVAEGLDPQTEHTLEILPVFGDPDQPLELRIESIGIVGAGAAAWAKE